MVLKEKSICTKETLVLGGSTAFGPIVVAAAGEFSRRACSREISIRNEGSWAGVADVLTGGVDAAFVDVELHDAQNELMSYPVAAFTIAFAVNPSACISKLTMSQLADILTGRLKNWKEVGGADSTIELIGRSAASGVRSIVQERALSNRSIVASNTCVGSNREAALAAQRIPGAFSYIALPAAQDLDVVVLAIDDVRPSNQHVLAGIYPFWACERVLLRRELQDRVLHFVDHIVFGSDLCDLLGYIKLNRMALYSAGSVKAYRESGFPIESASGSRPLTGAISLNEIEASS
jgi:phosphate transport system substrate-binding protein